MSLGGGEACRGQRNLSFFLILSQSSEYISCASCFLHDASWLKSNGAKALQITASETVSHISPFLFLNCLSRLFVTVPESLHNSKALISFPLEYPGSNSA